MTKFLTTLFILCSLSLNARPFVTTQLVGQLGNQMYQIALATSIALDHDYDALFPELKRQMNYNIPLNHREIFYRICTDEYPVPIEVIYKEPQHTFVPIPVEENMHLKGYFQSYKYFDHHRDTIVALFAPYEKLRKRLERKYPELVNDENSVAVHWRTYLSEDPKHRNFAECPPSYFLSAMSRFPMNTTFYVFSDNIRWCRNKFRKFPYNIKYITGNRHFEDFYLISMCKHQIISNSSFSWWAAYLNNNPNKIVVAPRKWFAKHRDFDNNDLLPEGWTVLDNVKF